MEQKDIDIDKTLETHWTAINNINTMSTNMISDQYNEETNYARYSYAIRNGELIKSRAATSGEFDEESWATTNVMKEVRGIIKITSHEASFSGSAEYANPWTITYRKPSGYTAAGVILFNNNSSATIINYEGFTDTNVSGFYGTFTGDRHPGVTVRLRVIWIRSDMLV